MDEQPSDLDQIRADIASLRAEVDQLRAESAQTRALTAMTDRDSADVRAAQRAHTASLGALRQTQVEQDHTLRQIAETVAGLAIGQAQHSEILAQHSEILAQLATGQTRLTTTVDQHGQTLAQHSEILAEILRRLPPAQA